MKKYRITKRKKNPIAKELSQPEFKKRVVHPRKIYDRTTRNKINTRNYVDEQDV